MQTAYTVSTYLIKKLHECDMSHIFGVPGIMDLDFMIGLSVCKTLEVINPCDEQRSKPAADAYARVRRLRSSLCHILCFEG